jgi:hypothetical protein
VAEKFEKLERNGRYAALSRQLAEAREQLEEWKRGNVGHRQAEERANRQLAEALTVIERQRGLLLQAVSFAELVERELLTGQVPISHYGFDIEGARELADLSNPTPPREEKQSAAMGTEK